MKPSPAASRNSWTGAVGRGMSAFRDLLVRRLGRLVSPNTLTVVGVMLSLATGCVLARGQFRWGTLLLLVASLFDVLDGAVARTQNLGTRFGAFLDSSLDRLSDFFIFGGLLGYYYVTRNPLDLVVTLAALSSAMLVSYTQARAECLIPSCKVGFGERPERIGILAFGGLFGAAGVEMAVWLIAVLATLTWLHRCWYTWRQLEGRGSQARRPRGPLTLVFWDLPRATPGYDAVIALLALAIVLYVASCHVHTT